MKSIDVLLMCPIYEPRMRDLEDTYTVHRLWEAPDRDALVRELAPRCRAVVTAGTRGMNAAEMDWLPHLELIACFGVGVDAVDVTYAHSRGIQVTNTPDVLTEDVADLALALLLGSVRRIPQGDRFVREGRWLKGAAPLSASLQRKRVGIVGLGRIGQAIARRCAAFGCEIAWWGPRDKAGIDWTRLPDVVALADWADILVAACPGGAATRHVVSRAALTALGPEGLFVNIARGSVVDQEALVGLLVSGGLGAAGLDVFDDEPRVPQALIDCERVVLSPHVGSGTRETRSEMGRLVLENVAAWARGEPLVTPV